MFMNYSSGRVAEKWGTEKVEGGLDFIVNTIAWRIVMTTVF
jgi:hypothetical protein